MEDQDPVEMQEYLTTTLIVWLDMWLDVEDCLAYSKEVPLPIMRDNESITI